MYSSKSTLDSAIDGYRKMINNAYTASKTVRTTVPRTRRRPS